VAGRKQAGDTWSGASLRLADLVSSRREAKGLTQEAVARKAKLALSTVRKIEKHGIREPGVFTVVALFRALELEFSELNGVLASDDQSASEPTS
jgi:transcriptional regulator with XRE-family HTH domain